MIQTMQDRRPIVELTNVSVTYNAGTPVAFSALRDVSLSIYENEYVVFFGPSGSGKSTLLYVIAGLEQPTKGNVRIKGTQDLMKLSETDLIEYHRYYVGMIFQAFYLVPTLTAAQNVAMPLSFAGVDPVQREKIIQPLLSRFGIADFANRLPSQLSGGQQQRVAIGRSLVQNPPIILADEPVGNLDSENAEKVLELLHELRTHDHKTIIHVTHDPRHLRRADRVFYIEDGAIVRVVENANAASTDENGEQTAETPARSTARLLGDVALENPYSAGNAVSAKLIAHQLLSPYSYYEMNAIEKVIEQYLSGQISKANMQDYFDRSSTAGGLGMYKQTASQLARIIDRYAREVHFLQDPAHKSFVEKAGELAHYFIHEKRYSIPEKSQHRFVELLAYRLASGIDAAEFRQVLDEPVRDGGVGLHIKTVGHIADEVETLIASSNPETYEN
jgi:putative ABC transport system ATP-binding protein